MLVEISRSLPGDPSACRLAGSLGVSHSSPLGEARRLICPFGITSLGVTITVEESCPPTRASPPFGTRIS